MISKHSPRIALTTASPYTELLINVLAAAGHEAVIIDKWGQRDNLMKIDGHPI